MIVLSLQEIQVKAMETSLVHVEKEMEVEADRSARSKLGMNAEMRRAEPGHLEEILFAVRRRWKRKTKIKRNQINSQEKDPKTSSLCHGIKVTEAGEVYPTGGSLKRKEKKVVETIASGKNGEVKAQGRKKSGREGRRRKNIVGRKKRGYKKREWWKRCEDFTQKDLQKRRRGKAGKEGSGKKRMEDVFSSFR